MKFNRNKKYKVIYADPPWYYANNKKRQKYGGAAMAHYPMVKLDELKRLPIQSICEDASILFLWATFPRLKDALELMESWGFIYRTIGFCWIKKFKNGKIESGRGMGFFTKENAEVCLIGTRYVHKGRNQIKVLRHDISSVIISERRRHSEKPDEVRHRIDMLFGNVSKIELFARQEYPGWDSWGNEL